MYRQLLSGLTREKLKCFRICLPFLNPPKSFQLRPQFENIPFKKYQKLGCNYYLLHNTRKKNPFQNLFAIFEFHLKLLNCQFESATYYKDQKYKIWNNLLHIETSVGLVGIRNRNQGFRDFGYLPISVHANGLKSNQTRRFLFFFSKEITFRRFSKMVGKTFKNNQIQ